MKPSASPDLLQLAGLTGLGAAGALAVFVLLSSLAKPPETESAFASISRAADLRRQAGGEPQPAGALGDQAICSSADQAAAIALDEQVQTASQIDGLTLGDVAVAPANETAAHLAVLSLKLHATGTVVAVNAFLGRLAAVEPVIFVDIADMRSTPQGASLDLSGRALCSLS